MSQLNEFVQLLHAEGTTKFWSNLVTFFNLYFRLEIEGIEHIPQDRPVIFAPNHSGFAGFDAVILLGHINNLSKKHPAKLLAHRAYFDWLKELKEIVESFGFAKASLKNGLQSLESGESLLIFPEGEDGNFKPSINMYQLQSFHSGFVRLAFLQDVPIVPCVVIGAEESHLNVTKLDFSKFGQNIKVPLPLNLMPLPAKWKIKFLPPIQLPTRHKSPQGFQEQVNQHVEDIRNMMQREIRAELSKRDYVYFETKALRSKIARFLDVVDDMVKKINHP